MANILITEPLPGDGIDKLAQKHHVTVARRGSLNTEDALIHEIKDYDALICVLATPVTENVMDAAPRLKVIANHAVGYNNIDTEAAQRRNIRVANTPDVLTDATADLAFSLLLSVTRRLNEAEEWLRAGKFDYWMPKGFLGLELSEAKMGIVGFGRIGRAVARRGKAFGMDIGYHNRTRIPAEEEAGLEATYFSEVSELAEWCDILSLHCPLNDASHHLIDSTILDKLGPEGYLINTARGPVVDETALAEALHKQKIAGAGIDVYENEPEVHPKLLSAPNAVLLPHIGSATHSTRHKMTELATTAIDYVLQGEPEQAANLVV